MTWRKEKMPMGKKTEKREFKMRAWEQDKERRRKKKMHDMLQSQEGRP